MSYNKSPLLTAAKWVLLLLVFTPFIVDNQVFFPYIEGKTVFLRAVAALALVLLALFLLFGKYSQRKEFLAEKIKLLKSPISILVALFLLTAGISTVFAKDSFRAFFGNVERGEGFMGTLFFTLIFYLALLLFEQKEWKWFFGGVALSGVIFFLHQIFQLSQASWDFGLRPFATFGNPSLLAGYYLFVIFSALALLAFNADSGRSKFVLIGVAAIAALGGIFLTQTRGTYLGFVAGIGAVGFYLLWMFFVVGFQVSPKRVFLSKRILKVFIPVSFLLVLIGGAFSMMLVLRSPLPTEVAEKEAPGFLSTITRRLTDTDAFQTRLIAARVALRSISPRNEGFDRFLFGWGQENFNIAYNTYFDPRYFLYEEVWFDRAHNKVLDTLVMQGLSGLVVFLGIWGLVLFSAFRINADSYRLGQANTDNKNGIRVNPLKSALIRVAVLFFAVSYFVHDLFLFDSPATGVALSMFFAFVVFQSGAKLRETLPLKAGEANAKPRETSKPYDSFAINQPSAIIVTICAIAVLILFFWATWFPYMQMRKYINLKTRGDLTLEEFTEKLDEVLSPYNYAQERIRIDLLKSLPDFEAKEGIAKLATKTFDAADELFEREPYEPRHLMNMGQVLEEVGGSAVFYEQAEGYYRRALALVPNRPDLMYLLAQNLLIQGKIEEAREGPLKDLFEMSKEIPKAGIYYGSAVVYATDEFREDAFQVLEHYLRAPGTIDSLGNALSVMRLIYNDFLIEFAKRRDEENFLRALETAIKVEEKWEKQQEEEFRQGKIKELPWEAEGQKKKSLIYKEILERFPEEGWVLVGVKE